jgi:hypothetical protein
MTSRKSIEKAKKLYREFRETAPKTIRRINIEHPHSVAVLGFLSAVDYTTTRRGKTELYRHEFSAGSRPYLCADGKTGQLFIIEGRYKVTARGITDIDAQGRLILDN